MCERRRCQKSLSKFWKYRTQQIYEDHKRSTYPLFSFLKAFFGGHFCSVFGFNPVKSDVDISLKFGLFTFQVNSDDLLRMRVVFRSMSEVKF